MFCSLRYTTDIHVAQFPHNVAIVFFFYCLIVIECYQKRNERERVLLCSLLLLNVM